MKAGVLPDSAAVPNLFEEAADMAVHIDGQGVVAGISVNPDSPSLGALDHWVGRAFTGFLTDESRTKFTHRLDALRADPTLVPRPLELNHLDDTTWEFPVRYTLHRVDGSGAVLMLGRDMQPIAELQQRLVKEQMGRERDQQKLRSEATFFRVVLEASETPIVLVEPQKGRIRDLNGAAATLLGGSVESLTGGSLAQTFDGRKPGEFMASLKAACGTDDAAGVEAVARRNGRAITVFPEMFRAAGDLCMLCRFGVAEEDGRAAPEFTQSLSALFAATSDAVALTDSQGNIREANEAFLVLTDAAELRDVREKWLGDFLVRGSIDLKLILEGASKQGSMRSYVAQLSSINGTRVGVDISAARLAERGKDLGYGFILREAAPADLSDSPNGAAAVSEEGMKNVMDLVGTAPLKDLVAATSDVIEKICIETAVDLTGNNRVAAAEMLGLSRQSLYVKLRKHGIHNPDADN
tara:strand:- start:2066 stop:3466 length:1401 start_codon:yes stop_codon:yes gene_type:complete